MSPLIAFHEPRWGSERRTSRREWELERLRAALAAGRSALIVGEVGFGRSHLARAAVGDPRYPGDCVLVCTTATTVEEIRERDAERDASPLALDDVHLLDPAALQAVAERVRRGAPTVLTAVAAPDTGLVDEGLRALQREGLLERIDIGGLDEEELGVIVAEAVHPVVFDTLRVGAIVTLAAGSPYRARELAFDAMRAESPLYDADRHPLLSPVSLSPRLAQVALANVPSVDEESAAAVVVLHEVGPQPRPAVVRLFGPNIAERLERMRLLHASADTERVAVDALAAEALRLRGEVRSAAEALRDAVFEGMWRQWKLALPFSESAELFLGMMLLARPGRVDDSDREHKAALLARAAAHATRRGSFVYAEGLARESLVAHPSPEAWVELSRAFIGQRRHQDAWNLLDRVDPDELDERALLDLLHTRMHLDGRLGTRSRETRELYERLRAHPSYHVSRHAQLAGYWGGLEEVDAPSIDPLIGVLDDDRAAEVTRLRAAVLLCVLLNGRTETDRMAHVLETGMAVYARVRSRRGIGHYLFEHDAPGLFLLFAECARLISGMPATGLLEALEDLRVRVMNPEIETSANERVAVLYAEGIRSFIRGDLPVAAAELRAASEQMSPLVPVQVTALLHLLHVAVYTEPDQDADIDRRHALVPVEMMPEGWRRVYGAMFDAIAPEGDVLDQAVWLRIMARYFDALYRGQLGCLGTTIGDREHAVPFPRHRAMVAHIEATAAGDPEALVQAGQALEDCNMYAAAMFAYEQARAIFQDRRVTARVNACAQDAVRVADKLRTVPEVPEGLVGGRAPLTPREREICELIAQGLRNHEIAARLFLSVRTVESHVLSARGKIGAARRADIPALLDAAR